MMFSIKAIGFTMFLGASCAMKNVHRPGLSNRRRLPFEGLKDELSLLRGKLTSNYGKACEQEELERKQQEERERAEQARERAEQARLEQEGRARWEAEQERERIANAPRIEMQKRFDKVIGEVNDGNDAKIPELLACGENLQALGGLIDIEGLKKHFIPIWKKAKLASLHQEYKCAPRNRQKLIPELVGRCKDLAQIAPNSEDIKIGYRTLAALEQDMFDKLPDAFETVGISGVAKYNLVGFYEEFSAEIINKVDTNHQTAAQVIEELKRNSNVSLNPTVVESLKTLQTRGWLN